MSPLYVKRLWHCTNPEMITIDTCNGCNCRNKTSCVNHLFYELYWSSVSLSLQTAHMSMWWVASYINWPLHVYILGTPAFIVFFLWCAMDLIWPMPICLQSQPHYSLLCKSLVVFNLYLIVKCLTVNLHAVETNPATVVLPSPSPPTHDQLLDHIL